ncbi:DNA/RNA non-specific endonuclease [Brochothrix thermosphacta]|uniref:DNA/RNA non-specific endonuclease n=1 Tax=Brochothrix thermosphacta TaxID=2756 RepID=UPI0039AF1E7A
MAKKKQYRKITKKEYKRLSKMKLSSLLIVIALALVVQLYNYYTNDTKKDTHSSSVSNESRASKYKKTAPPINETDDHLTDNGAPDFSDADLDESQSGYIHYGELDKLGRVTTAEALITKSMYDTGTKAEYNIKPTGFISGKEPYLHSRGHLIGKQLGGSGTDRRNLMTIYQYPVNSPDMTNYENAIRKSILKGDKVRYRVIPIFKDDELMPAYVKMEGQSLTTKGDIKFNITIKNER